MVILLDVRDGVHKTTRPQHVGIFGIERLGDDTGLVLAHFKVRVREADEDLGELVLGEEVGEEFHRVAAECGDVFVVAGDEGVGGAFFFFCLGGGSGGGGGIGLLLLL